MTVIEELKFLYIWYVSHNKTRSIGKIKNGTRENRFALNDTKYRYLHLTTLNIDSKDHQQIKTSSHGCVRKPQNQNLYNEERPKDKETSYHIHKTPNSNVNQIFSEKLIQIKF